MMLSKLLKSLKQAPTFPRKSRMLIRNLPFTMKKPPLSRRIYKAVWAPFAAIQALLGGLLGFAMGLLILAGCAVAAGTALYFAVQFLSS